MAQKKKAQTNSKSGEKRIAHEIAKHATRVAVASAVVAGVATLADKKTRDDILMGTKKMVDKAAEGTKTMGETMQEQYAAVSHRIAPKQNSRKRASRRRSSKKTEENA